MPERPAAMPSDDIAQFHVYNGRRTHRGDFTRQTDRWNGMPYFTLCGQRVIATFIEPSAHQECSRCRAIGGER